MQRSVTEHIAWRLQVETRWLNRVGQDVGRVAERCGYDSVPAFSKAFKRYFGISAQSGSKRDCESIIPNRLKND
ncbi:helix-turn-helix domain-containing protein [Methylobacter svalbardensis]|uniref:helix-turn-helix domain-containing protein n=1 Tax=Methylobacter svalbardensis TaxID=3080016 RepID=UPI0030EC1EEA